MTTTHHRSPVRLPLAVAVGVAVVAGLGASRVPVLAEIGWVAPVLAGYVVGSLTLVGWLLRHWMPLGPSETRRQVAGQDPGAALPDLVVNAAAMMSLLGVGTLMLGGGSNTPRSQQLTAALLAIATVAVGWACIHTLYALRYARLYYADDTDDIDFNTKLDPPFTDFAYFSFNLGMTYQVSDTSTQSARIRKIVLGHTLIAYVYGAVIVASAINLVVGLG